jgi:uncharacterized membrane protein YhaH (DUF805 family)
VKLLLRMSKVLNTVLIGAHVKSEPDGLAQWNSFIFSCTINLLLVFIVVAGLFALCGAYQPFIAPLATPALQLVVATTNLVTLALTYVASLSWEMNEAAIERLHAAGRTRAEYWLVLAALAVTALLVAALLFLTCSFMLLIVAACINAMVLQFMWSQRILNSTHGMNKQARPNAASG